MKKKNIIEKSLENKRYKAIEKISHETDMRIKSWMIQEGIYFAPMLFLVAGWWFYITIKNAFAPYGIDYSYFQTPGIIVFFLGGLISIASIKYAKPKVEEALKKETNDLSEDVYQKGAKFDTLVNFNKNIKQYMEEEQALSHNPKSLEMFKIKMTHLNEEDDQYYDEVEDLVIPRISLATGLCIMGAPGQGKSVLINQIIKQTPATSKQIIIDVKGEFLEKHYNKETDYILCPSDVRTLRFSLSNLLKSKIDTGIIAETLITDDKQSQDPHWVAAARCVMEAILIYASKRNLSNKKIYEMVSSPRELIKILDDEEAKMVSAQFLFFEANGAPTRATESVLSSLIRKAKILQYLAYLDDIPGEKMYFDKWVNDGKGGKLFLVATENLSKVFSPLYGVITSYLLSSILDLEDTKTRDYYFILDELPRLGKIIGENLEKALAVGRSKGIKVLMAMQSYSQIKKEFGEKEAESMLDTTNSFLIFKNNFGAQFLEKLFGKTTIIRNNESFSFGMHDMADRSQLQRQMVKENLIDESEITMLNKFEFYAKIEGCKWILKGKFAPVFLKNNGTKKYIESKTMAVKVLTEEMEKNIQNIQNKYIDFQLAGRKNAELKVNF
ncbi:type IV secretory system conjugative DNA transfer family protein [Sulfurospirillum sp. 1612]|uniref:type IV secretory system conjugative DNA transfer family protein n=1 Tax=Sulfurospirillum sp. 1612 TaxID=3094835 RepID=UPI002F93FBF5